MCRVAGFEPDVRYVTADLQAHIDLVRGGHAASVLPDLVWAGREPDVRLIGLPGSPRRTVFTSSRVGSLDRPGIRACRDALARAVEVMGPGGG